MSSDAKSPAAAVNAADSKPAATGPAFVPKDTVNVVIGKQNVNLYPTLDPSWNVQERAYAFHLTTTALKGLHLTSDVYIDNLGVFLGCQTVVAGLKTDFMDFFHDNWLNMNHLEILSFHNTAGAVIGNATLPNDPAVLKPVVDGAVANCRPADVHYVRLQLTLDYADLATGASATDNTTLRCQFYLELPQTLEIVLDGAANPRSLVTFHGAADLRTLSVDQIQDDILSLVPQDAPVGLAEAPFNVTNALVDETIMESISRSILKLAVSTFEKEVFLHLCPGYTNKPHASIEGISQTYPDEHGNIVCMTVAQYSSVLQNAARPFAHLRVYPCDLCGHFMQNLHPDVKAAFEDLYDDHAEPHDRNGRFQRTAYAKILKLATKAESQVKSTQNLVARQVGQSFVADALASQAERTLNQYNKPPPSSRRNQEPSTILGKGHSCHGCGKTDHVVADCPDKGKPGFEQRVKRARDKFYNEKLKGKRGRWQRHQPDLKDMSPAVRAKITQQVLDEHEYVADSPSVNSSLTGSALSPIIRRPGMGRGNGGSTPARSGQAGGGGGPFVFIGDVCAMAGSTKEILPVPINTNLPHIKIQLGSSDMKGDSPVITCILDTAAALSTGNSHFLFNLAKTFPGCVAAVYTHEHYSGIVLSGIVQRNGEAVTTELTVAFLFNLPYYTVDGAPAQLMIAAGPHVNANVIIGTPFLTAARVVVDFGDSVAECRALDCPPFPLEFKRARLSLPNVQASMVTGHDHSDYSAFLADLETLEAHVHKVDAVPRGVRKKGKRVQFQPREAREPKDDGLSRYRPLADHVPYSVLPRENLTNQTDLAGESHSADNDVAE